MTPHAVRRPAARAVAVILAAASLGAACGDDADESTASTTTTAAATPTTGAEAPASVIEITGAWARTSPAMVTAGAVYLTIANVGSLDDALLAASVDPTVAGSVELHETVAAETDATTTTAMGGTTGMTGGDAMMTMQPVERIPVPAGGSVALEPGGYHVMLLGLVAPLEVGSTIDVTFTFDEAGEQVVTVDVRDMAP